MLLDYYYSIILGYSFRRICLWSFVQNSCGNKYTINNSLQASVKRSGTGIFLYARGPEAPFASDNTTLYYNYSMQCVPMDLP